MENGGLAHRTCGPPASGRALRGRGLTVFVSLMLGFGAVTLTAVAFGRWGRSIAAAALLVVGAIALGLAWTLNGRDGLGDLALGALLALPVLIGSALRRDRATRLPLV